jgi:uncharacterized protein
MKSQDVAAYLQQHTEFFEEYADMLAEITIPHPYGGRAIPISERQILALREKGRQLESKLRELIQFGEENDAISEKVHRMAIALLAAPDLARLIDIIQFNLREDFAVPHVVLRAWHPAAAAVPGLDEASAVTRDFALSLMQPYCSSHPMVDTAVLFGEAASQLRSFSYIPLRDREVFGLLVLASESPQRFYPEMGTVFLKRLGGLVSAALWRHLEAAPAGA